MFVINASCKKPFKFWFLYRYQFSQTTQDLTFLGTFADFHQIKKSLTCSFLVLHWWAAAAAAAAATATTAAAAVATCISRHLLFFGFLASLASWQPSFPSVYVWKVSHGLEMDPFRWWIVSKACPNQIISKNSSGNYTCNSWLDNFIKSKWIMNTSRSYTVGRCLGQY